MKRVIYFFILLGLSSGYAQENDVIEYDEIVAQMENAASSEYEPNITMGIANGEFNNTAYKLNGQIWNLAPTITKKESLVPWI